MRKSKAPVPVPPIEQTEAQKVDFAIEMSFNTLISQVKKSNIQIHPVMGFVYLPDEKLAQDFKVACRNIVAALKVQPPTPEPTPVNPPTN